MNRVYPQLIYLDTRGFSNTTGASLTQEINSITILIGNKTAQKNGIQIKLAAEESRLQGLKSFYAQDRAYYEQYAKANNWTAAEYHGNRADNETMPAIIGSQGLISGYKESIKDLNEEINGLQDQRKALVDQQIAENKEKLANANLTPAQRLALEKQRAELERLAKESETKGKLKKYLFIGGGILGGIALIGYIIYLIRKRKKASA